MTEKKKSASRAGCAVVILVVIPLAVAAGVWLGRVDETRKSPCERYAEVVARALDNCHSGVNRSRDHHVAVCEAEVDPSEACLEAMQRLPCKQLEQGPEAAGDVCRKAP